MDVENENKQSKKKDIFQKKKEQKRNESSKKYKKSKEYKNKVDDNFLKPKTSSELAIEKKVDRLNRKMQIRKQKINEHIFKRRGLIDSDGNSSIDVTKNKSMTLSNLTQLIDLTVYKIPPKICALISLNEDANLDLILANINKVIASNLNDIEKSKYDYTLNKNTKTYIIPSKLYKGKERLTFIKTKRDIYSILDACKIADIIMFVSSCKKCQADKWQLDPDKYSFCIDDFGYEIISIIRAQGLTDHICCIQDLNTIAPKRRTEIIKLYSRYFTSEVKPSKIFDFFNNEKEGEDPSMDLHDENQIKAILRLNCALAPYTTNLDLQKHRSYMMIENIKKNENNEAEIFGYIRGNTLNPGKYIHITGFGDYKIKDVEVAEDPLPVKSKFENNSKKNVMEVENNENSKKEKKKENKEVINNSLRSNNSSEKENNNYNSNNVTNNTNKKNSKKVFNSIINAGNNWKYKKNKQLIQKNINILDNITRITKGIQIKYNSSNTSKYKLNNKSTNINISNSPISKTKYNHLYDKKKIEINDNNFPQNEIVAKQLNSNLSREKSAGIIKQKEKIKKKKVTENPQMS